MQMKTLRKILTAPLRAALAVLIWIGSAIVRISAGLFGFVSAAIAALGVLAMFAVSARNGLILLLIAVLVSPVGLPMIAVRLLGALQFLRYALK